MIMDLYIHRDDTTLQANNTFVQSKLLSNLVQLQVLNSGNPFEILLQKKNFSNLGLLFCLLSLFNFSYYQIQYPNSISSVILQIKINPFKFRTHSISVSKSQTQINKTDLIIINIKMSKSQHQFQINQDHVSNTIYSHHRSRSKRFRKNVNTSPLINKAKQLYQKGELKQSLFYFQEGLRSFEVKEKQLNNQISEVEILYQSGTISLAIGQFAKAEAYFKKIVKFSNNYKGNTLLLLAISLNKMGRNQDSLNVLDKLCKTDKPIDGLFYRGKLRLKNMNYHEAYQDFIRIIEQCKVSTLQIRLNLIQAKLYSIDLGNDKNQLQTLLSQSNKILDQLGKNEAGQTQSIRRCRNIKIQILLLQQKLQEAEQQINRNLSTGKRDSWTLLLKSKLLKKQNKIDDQILLLNECITIKDNKRSVIQSLQTLLLHAMSQKDFYEAFQYSKRNTYIKIEHKPTLCLFKIAEAVTFLMKKKYGEALLLIGAIDPEIYLQINGDFLFIKNLHLSALGYAYFSIGQHKDALQMYKKIQINPQDSQHVVHLYNRKLCEGILAYKENKIEESIKIFQSSTDYLMRAEPYFYISVILVQKSLSGNTDPQLITKVVEIIDSGLKVGQNYQMYYYRALLYFYLGMNAQALDDVDKAVQKSEQNVARFFFLRGLIFFQERNYENAKAELATCLSIDQKYYNAYLQRAKIKLLSDEIEQAYEDLQNYPLNQDWKPLFLLHQRHFAEILEKKIGQEWVIEAASFQVGRFQDAGPAGKVIMAIVCQNYQQVLSLLQDALDINFQIGCLDIDDIYSIKSYCCFKLGLFDKCVQMLQKSQQMLKKQENNFYYGEQDEKKLLAIKVNAIYAYLGSQNIEKSKQLCQSLINDVYEGAVYDELIKIESYLESITSNQEKETIIQLFVGNSLLSDYFSQESIRKLKFKYLLSFPKLRVPEIENVPFEQPLIQFTMKQIDNRAEAPWMNKGEYGVIFTNKIEVFENLKLYTETEENNSMENRNNKTSKERLKQELQLDAEVLNKLQKLSKNKKPIKSDQAL